MGSQGLAGGLHGLEGLLMGSQGLADGASLLGAEVLRLVLLSAVELPQVVLLLLVHHDVHAGHGLADYTDLGQLRSGATGDLGHSELGQLSLEVIELLHQVLLLLGPQLGAFYLTHDDKGETSFKVLYSSSVAW